MLKCEPACLPAVQQVAFADKILLNKVDLVDAASLRAVAARIKARMRASSQPLPAVATTDL